MIWYDPHLRLWTLQTIDNDGNQIGQVDYTVIRANAFRWLDTGDTEDKRCTGT